MKFKEEVCGNCGFDLTTAEPTMVREIPIGAEEKMVPYAECPRCHTNRIVVAPEAMISPAPEPPVVRGGRRRASEPEPEAPPEEPGAEE